MEYDLIKKNNKKKLLFLVLTLIMCLGTSLAAVYFVYNYQDSRQNSLTTALVSINYTEGTEIINLENQVPVIDEIGLENTPYEFTVQNTSQVPINLKIQIVSDNTSTIPLGAIRYALYIDNQLMTISNMGTKEDNTLYTYENFPSGETVNAKLIMWVDYYYTEPNTTFSASIKVTGESFDMIYQPTAAETIKESVVSYSVASASGFQGGLVAINGTTGSDYGLLYNETNQSHTIREYRYSGPSVNNYIYYNCPDTAGGKNYGDLDYDYQANCEVWRIVGIFKENDEEYLKIMRNNVLEAGTIPTTYTYEGTTYSIASGTSTTRVYWNSTKTTKYNDWTTAGLQYYLNTERDTNGVAGYLSRISTTSKNLIRETTYYLGNVIYNTDTTLTAYDNERKDGVCPSTVTSDSHDNNCNIWSGNQPSWNGKVALLYPSDYGYSALPTYWSGTKLNDYSGSAVKASTWMQQTANHSDFEWLLSPAASSSSRAVIWYSTGYLDNYSVTSTIGARAVLNLKSQIGVLKGDGTSNYPYVVIE